VGASLIRIGTSLAWDDGPGKSSGEPSPVPPDADKEYRRLASSLEFYHQVSCKFGYGVVLPYLRVHVDDNPTGESGDRSGVGDIRGYLVWSPWAPEAAAMAPFLSLENIHFGLGVSLPTAYDRPASEPVGRDGQLGSGSIDLRFGVTYWGYITPNWCAFANTSIVLDTGYDVSGYRNSPSYSLRIGGGWLPIPEAQLYLSFRTNYSGKNLSEPEPDGVDADSGGNFLYFAPGFVVKPLANVLIDFAVSLPLYHRVNGSQVLPGNTLSFGVSYKW